MRSKKERIPRAAGGIPSHEGGQASLRLRLITEAATVARYEGLEPAEQELVDWLVQIFHGSKYDAAEDARSKQFVTKLFREHQGAELVSTVVELSKDEAAGEWVVGPGKSYSYPSARVIFGSIVAEVQKFSGADNAPAPIETYAFLREEAFGNIKELSEAFEVSDNSIEKIEWLIDSYIKRQIVKTVETDYSGSMTAAAFAAAARTFSDRELKEYVQKGEVAAAVLGERETTSRSATATPRLEHAATETTTRKRGPRAKATPRPDWIEARKRGVTVPDFIADKFAAELADGTMTRAMLNRYDKLSSDFYGYPRHHEMPEWLKAIPTQDEWKKRQIAEGKASPVEAPLPPPRTDEDRAYDRGRKRVAAARRQGIPVLDHP